MWFRLYDTHSLFHIGDINSRVEKDRVRSQGSLRRSPRTNVGSHFKHVLLTHVYVNGKNRLIIHPRSLTRTTNAKLHQTVNHFGGRSRRRVTGEGEGGREEEERRRR